VRSSGPAMKPSSDIVMSRRIAFISVLLLQWTEAQNGS
jgi:hypothetical protein